MLRRSAVWVVALAAIVGGVWVQQAISADAGGAPPPTAPSASAQQRIDQFRQQMSDRMKQSLGVTDEEWKVLQPLIDKVQTLARETRGGGGMSSTFGRGRGGPPPSGGASDRPPSDRPQPEVEIKADALRKILENKDAPADQIKTALAALREARAKAAAELETAQKELREVVTVRQEAQLVMMGLLE
jgi:hypothetical protein